jgi:hypothetical protein
MTSIIPHRIFFTRLAVSQLLLGRLDTPVPTSGLFLRTPVDYSRVAGRKDVEEEEARGRGW